MNPTIVISTRIGTTVVNDYQTTGGGGGVTNGILQESTTDFVLLEDGSFLLQES
jgi:hypothetical protein